MGNTPVKEGMKAFVQQMNKMMDDGIRTAILACGYQIDEVLEYLKNKQRFEMINCYLPDLKSETYLKDKYQSVTYLLMTSQFVNCGIEIEVFKRKKVDEAVID